MQWVHRHRGAREHHHSVKGKARELVVHDADPTRPSARHIIVGCISGSGIDGWLVGGRSAIGCGRSSARVAVRVAGQICPPGCPWRARDFGAAEPVVAAVESRFTGRFASGNGGRQDGGASECGREKRALRVWNSRDWKDHRSERSIFTVGFGGIGAAPRTERIRYSSAWL